MLLGKYYLYTCKVKDAVPSLIAFKKIVRLRYLTEKGRSVYKGCIVEFERNWLEYKELFEEV